MKGTGTSYDLSSLSREIMGVNFIGPDFFSMGAIPRLSEVPFKKETLFRHRDSGLLAAVPPVSLLEMNADHRLKEMFYLRSNLWYADQMFAGDESPGWHLLPKKIKPIYFGKNWVEQTNLLPNGHRVATVQSAVYAMLAYYRATGEMLHKNIRLRCADVPFGRGSGQHVVVNFTGRMIFIGWCDDMENAPDLGLATEVMPE